MGKNVKIFMSHVNAHQWVTSVKENFNNQVNRMTHSVDTSQLLSPATSVIAYGAHKKVVGTEIMHGFSNMNFCSTRQIWL